MTLAGIAALAVWAVHLAAHLAHGDSWANALWVCPLGAVLVGVGLLARAATPTAIGAMWLLVGLPLWSIEIFTGEQFLWTSWPLHLIVPALGAWGVRRLGMPAGAAWKALAGVAAMQALCRLVTPPVENVNMVFAQQPEWRGVFPSYFWNYVGGCVYYALAFVGLERLGRRFARSATDQSRPGRSAAIGRPRGTT